MEIFQEFSTVAMKYDQKLASSLQNLKVLTNPPSIILKKTAETTHYLYYGHQKAFLQNIKSKFSVMSERHSPPPPTNFFKGTLYTL